MAKGKGLKITRVVTGSSTIPFNNSFYEDMTLEQAIEFERNGENNDWQEWFFECNTETRVDTYVEVVEVEVEDD